MKIFAILWGTLLLALVLRVTLRLSIGGEESMSTMYDYGPGIIFAGAALAACVLYLRQSRYFFTAFWILVGGCLFAVFLLLYTIVYNSESTALLYMPAAALGFYVINLMILATAYRNLREKFARVAAESDDS